MSIATFFLVHLLPGNPTDTILGPNATPQNVATLNHQLGLDKPLWQQYFIWIGHVFQGNLGQSYTTHQSTCDHHHAVVPHRPRADHLLPDHRLRHRLPHGHALGPPAQRLVRPGIEQHDVRHAGAAALRHRAGPGADLRRALARLPGPASYVPLTQEFWSNIHTMLLPSIVLALGGIVVYFRLLRNDLISTLQEDFITMARSKGLSDRRIMWRHALRPSSISLLASAGVTIGSLIAGTFIVELLLQMPGLGYQLISAVNQDDYTVVQGITLFVAVAIVLVNFIFDFLFTIVDPRIARE